MKMTKKGLVWILLVLMVISQFGCGTRSRASKDSVTVTRKVIKWQSSLGTLSFFWGFSIGAELSCIEVKGLQAG